MTNNDTYYEMIASIHGIIGLVIFATGILQFALTKGTTLHKITGYIYLISWVGIIGTGAYIGSMVIVAIVVLGFYLCITGIRAAALQGKPYNIIDKTIVLMAALIVLFMLYAAIALIIKQSYTYAILAAFFALLYLWVVGRDVLFYIMKKKVFKNDYGEMNWYINHLTRMQFSFVTAVGAFTAVQNVFHNTVLNFILPAVIGFIVISKTKTYFINKANIKAIIP